MVSDDVILTKIIFTITSLTNYFTYFRTERAKANESDDIQRVYTFVYVYGKTISYRLIVSVYRMGTFNDRGG